MNRLYPSYREYCLRAFHQGTIPSEDIAVTVCGVDDTYVYSDAHQTADALGTALILPPLEIPNLTFDLGILGGDNVTWIAPDVAGLTLQALVLVATWEDDGGGTQLMAYIDSIGTQLPQLLNAYDFTVIWNDLGIFKI